MSLSVSQMSHLRNQGMMMCPQCRLFKPVSQYIDSQLYVMDSVCNACRKRYFMWLKACSEKTSTITQYHTTSGKVAYCKQKPISTVVPKTTWVPSNRRKKENVSKVTVAKLVYHRLYCTQLQ